MAVPEQTPYIEHIANGVTTSFSLGFVCDSADKLVVTVNNLPTNVGDWSFGDGSVVFQYPPLSDSTIKIWRNSPLARSTTFKTYDNSLNPNSLNLDLDKIWLVMQELNVKNFISDNKLQELLDKLVDGDINGLPAEVLARIAGDESIKSLVNLEAIRAYQAESNLSVRIDNESLLANQNILAEKQRAEAAEQGLQIQVNSVGVGNKAYLTYALMDADKANIPAKSKVTVTNDSTTSNNGDWQWDGVAFTKSAYDQLTQAKTYADIKTTDTFNNSATLSIDLVRGGNHYYAKSENLTFDGFITSAGVFTASSGGYKTSDFILVDISKPLVYSINASTTVSGISFWDANKAFISSINTNNDATQKTSAIPLNTKFIRVSNYATSNPNGYVYSAFENVLNQAQVAKEYSNILISGGNLIDVKPADFVFDGYITNTGSFTVSAAGYKTTDFIALYRLSTLTYSLNTSSVISSISYWDVNKNFIGYVTTNNIITEAQSVPPENTKYIRVTNNMNETPNPYLKMTVSAVTNDPNLLKSNDLTITPSLNLANPALIVNDFYVNNSGTITNGAGWKYIKVPVKPNTSYAFGRFTVDTGGYYAFYDSNSVLIADTVSVVAGYIAQKVVSSPSNAAYFLLDIARPTNTSDQYSQLTINEGTSIIDYVAPTGTITKIKGFPLSGSDSGGGTPAPVPENVVVQGGSATLADVIADSVTTGALIANLPTSSTGLEVGQAYIDNGTVKVVMA